MTTTAVGAASFEQPSVGLLPPRNVALRYLDDETTIVEALDPSVMVSLIHENAPSFVAGEPGRQLRAALEALTPTLTRNRTAPSQDSDLPRHHLTLPTSSTSPRSHHG